MRITTKIGLVGLGRIGQAMAQRLHAHGADIVGWDRNSQRLQACEGIRPAATGAEVAAQADIVISVVTDDAGIRGLFRGADGFFSTDVAGKLFLEMSTLQPMTVRELAAEAEARGAGFLDAPLLGSIPTVQDGKLLILAGGRPECIAQARPVFDVLAREVVHMGPSGSGSAMKLAVNVGLAAYLQALAEGLALGVRQGLDLALMLRVMTEAPTANGWLRSKLGILQGEAGATTLDIVTLRKDIMSAVATGALSGVPMPLSSGVLASLSAAVAEGRGGEDIAQMPSIFREIMTQSID